MSFLDKFFGPPDVNKLKLKKDISGLIKALGYEKDVAVRMSAVEALGSIGDKRAVEPLIAICKDVGLEKEIRIAAIKALEQVGDPLAVKALADALSDVTGLAAPAAQALIKIGDPSTPEVVISVMKEGVKNKDHPIKVLLSFGKAAVEPVFALIEDECDDNRLAAAYILGEIGDPKGVSPLISLLQDKEGFVRAGAAKALGKLGDSLAVAPLLEILPTTYPGLADAVVEALVMIRDPEAIEPLIIRLKIDSVRYRERIGEALARFGKPAIAVLIPMLKNNDISVQATAASVLAHIGELSVEPLITALSDDEHSVRKAAAEVLGKIGDPLAVDPLTAILKDVADDMRSTAAEALQLISDQQEKNKMRKDKEKSKDDSIKNRVRPVLQHLSVIKKQDMGDFRQRIIRFSKPPHPCMFSGSLDEATDFVAMMVRATEAYIRSCEGIVNVENSFLITNIPVREVLEIQYEQFWASGPSSIYSEHVARMGEDQFEVFGSEKSASRMAAIWKK